MKITILLSLLSPLLTIVMGIKQRFTLLWYYAATGFIIDNTAQYLKLKNIEYHWPGNLFLLAEFLFISLFYKKHLYKSKTLFWGVTIPVFIFFILNTIYNSVFEFNMFGAGIFCLVYIIYGLLGFYQLLQRPVIIYLNKIPFFWINLAFFLYSSANCLLFLFGSYLRATDFQLLFTIWGIFFTSINILHYLLIGIALNKTKQSESC